MNTATLATSYGAYARARNLRSWYMRELIRTFMWSMSKAARRAYGRLRRQHRALAMTAALPELDDHMMRDIGLQRGDLADAFRAEWRMRA